MSDDSTGGPTQIFISYRRQDSGQQIPGLSTLLANRFGEENVFWDVDTLGHVTGLYKDYIDRMLASCHAALIVIGRQWLDAKDDEGRLRLDDPADIHRQEIEAALNRGDVEVIPVLVDGATMPAVPRTTESRSTRSWSLRRRQWAAPELPAALEKLALYQAHELSHQHYGAQVNQLIRKIEQAREAADEAARTAQQAADEAEEQLEEKAFKSKARTLAEKGEFEKAREITEFIDDPVKRLTILAKIAKIAREKGADVEAEKTKEALHRATDLLVEPERASELIAEEDWATSATAKVRREVS